MIPSTNTLLNTTLEFNEQPSKNYKMNFESETIVGTWQDLEAMKQVVYKILNTERYRHVVYSKNYGIELDELYGEPASYVCPELERRIGEALLQDERITAVDSFTFDLSEKRKIKLTFKVYTTFGELDSSTEVEY